MPKDQHDDLPDLPEDFRQHIIERPEGLEGLSAHQRFAFDPVEHVGGNLQYEAPSVQDSYTALLREFLEADPIRLWLWQHSPVAHAVISRLAMHAARTKSDAIDPVDVVNEFERQRREQDRNWGQFEQGATE